MRNYTLSDIQLIGENNNLDQEAVDFLFFLTSKSKISSGDILSSYNQLSSRQQLKRLLFKITPFMTITGKASSTLYRIDARYLSQQFMAIDTLFRSASPFDPYRIAHYKPNQTFLMDRSVRLELMALSQSTIKKGMTLNDRIFKRLLIDFSWESSSLEGNTYTLLETQELIEQSIKATGKKEDEHIMILNHAKAISFLIENSHDIELTSFDVRGIHSLLSKELLGDPLDCGAVRNKSIKIGGSRYEPENSGFVLKEYLSLIIEKYHQIKDPFEQSFFLMLNLSYLQGFIDVNKRTGRVLANLPLLKNTLCPISFIGINKDSYIYGLLEYYETGETTVVQEAYLSAYKQSILRYQETLSEVYPNKKASQVDQIAKEWIRLSLDKNKKGSRLEFIRFVQSKITDQDINYEDITKLLDNIDAVKAISIGITAKKIEQYKALTKSVKASEPS